MLVCFLLLLKLTTELKRNGCSGNINCGAGAENQAGIAGPGGVETRARVCVHVRHLRPTQARVDMIKVVHHTVESGITFFDTSDFYGPHTNEVLLGKIGADVFALKEIGVEDSIRIFKEAFKLLVISGQGFKQPFKNSTFDFVFSCGGMIEKSTKSADFVMEIFRTLKPEGWHDKAMLYEQYHWKKALEKKQPYKFLWNQMDREVRDSYYFNWPVYFP
ncbi:Uncharacterized protein Fot_28319 [Forsythia ovata]|uniref:NADP-dependent oxidoreductase domain-containing protein n=1 Tax=Forsythia ovata TaxID=205694 RepID=A0ABD1TNN0_9LAMI